MRSRQDGILGVGVVDEKYRLHGGVIRWLENHLVACCMRCIHRK